MAKAEKITTQAKILEAAEALFWRQGHKATSLDAIAKRAKQSKGAVFHYFSNKNDVTLSVLHQYAAEELFAPLDRAFAQNKNVKDALMFYAQDLYVRYGEEAYKGGCLLGNMALELSDQDESIRLELAKVFLEFENKLVNHLKESAGSAEILMEPRQFARVFVAVIQGITMTIKVHKDKNRAAREFQALAEMVERLIRG
ncbi:MAG: TetR/AcrR family transcriptional regulator [Alphaproteobacteria bacterium]